ncbi:uncharacterized protein LOC107824023 isoform X1 [Nicotiana tabacum]|uniref:Uncharacterized protein LOC107824023 isoform X1 n=1 Tax=Nicotiana tabacum TaxID=4097 RepID=A0A1S4CZ04_TOBAC|nr:uncharacterized protein LOC104086794 isoform X1 [Nicotiana tomentosiformis]XP_016506234.1 PREDICTED: uncharacterized protein LOC107824023 isoform X1 [Nicotiana tabacum]
MDTEFQDWELLHPNSASDSVLPVNLPQNQEDTFVEETKGLIQPNYFSIDSHSTPTFAAFNGSEESDNPTWIDSGSERSEDRQFGEFDGKNDVGVFENSKLQVGSGGIGDISSENGKNLEVGVVEDSKLEVALGGIEDISSENGKNLEVAVVGNSKLEVGFGGIEDISSENGENEDIRSENEKNLGEFWSDTGGDGIGDVKFGDVEERSEACVEQKDENERVESQKRDEIEASKGGEEKRSLVWWKVPLELLKYCVFRVRPMWAFSVAAAVMGFVILGRRLYKMKKKTKSLELKVTVDDKKVSQFMSRAARLNEAFSVVKRVPVIRPQLPAPGVSPWPVVSLHRV